MLKLKIQSVFRLRRFSIKIQHGFGFAAPMWRTFLLKVEKVYSKNLNEMFLLKQNNSFKYQISNIHILLIEPPKYII